MPVYLNLLRSGELKARAEVACRHLEECALCGWACGTDRTAGRTGVCRTTAKATVSSYGPHMGEEAPLTGRRGSGTIFFAGCNLKCVFCQNWDISQTDDGDTVEPEDLARIMLTLQDRGCHNINFVSPTHVLPAILTAVAAAAERGLELPLVWNTGGYDSLQALSLLDGVIDIYMPDMKFADPEAARRLAGPADYPEVNQAAVKEMHRQVGDLQTDARGLATRGLLVRHLVLPEGLAGTAAIVRFLANEISKDTYINIMEQYYPAYKARQLPELSRRLTRAEYAEAVRLAREAGLHRLD